MEDELERVYAEWQEAEARASQWRAYERECAELPDTPAGRERERYLRQKASFSPAYFSGSLAHRQEQRRVTTSARVLKCLGGLSMLMMHQRAPDKISDDKM